MEEVCTADCVRHVNASRAKRGGEPERNTYIERKNVVKYSVVYDSELLGNVHIWYRLNNDENISDSHFSEAITVLVEDAEDGGARRKSSILMEYVVYIMCASKNNQKCRT
jgi:macrodomain Ter protein organizer (MatP/YcbG family)